MNTHVHLCKRTKSFLSMCMNEYNHMHPGATVYGDGSSYQKQTHISGRIKHVHQL